MEIDEKLFTIGFNSGYCLAKFEPQVLASLLRNIRPLNSFIVGMASGQKEYELGKVKINLDELESLRQKSRDPNNLERD